MLGNVDVRTLQFGVLGTGLVAALSPLDRPVKDRAIEGFSSPVRHYATATNYLGEAYVAIPTTLGLWGISMLTDDLKFRDAAFTSAQALLYASTATIVLKVIVGRTRPNETDSPYRFSPFSGAHSFPSGHTTAVFASLVPWLAYYPGPLTWSLVVVAAGGTAFARIEHNKHWLTDVVAGGAIGTIAALLLSRRHQHSRGIEKGRLSELRILPVASATRQGLVLHLSLR